MRRELLAALLALVVFAPLLWLGVSEPAPTTNGCASCHEPVAVSSGHRAFAGQCARCHLGDPTATSQEAAHVGLEREPGALDTAARTCGACHPAELQSVSTSLMATARGLVSVDAWAFGEQLTPDGGPTLPEVLALPGPSASQEHVRRLCAGCHLGSRADNRDDVIVGVGSGCGACHTDTSGAGHPISQLVPADKQCFGCHSRSARIALSYQGQAEVEGCADGDTLADERTLCRRPADVHALAGLGCVDCHLHTELMGDGGAWTHEEQAVEVRCASCHSPTATPWSEVKDPVSRALVRLHGEAREPAERVPVASRGTPLWNVRPAGEGWVLFGKRDGAAHAITPTPADADHDLLGHERLSCQACHAQWAPTCPACHTSRDPNGVQWDFGDAALRPGAWVEHGPGVGTAPPTLALRGEQVVPAIPGMIATIELPDGTRRELRRFSALDPHTTGPARACASCHTAAALGVGQGAERWVRPEEDVGDGTRADVRSLNLAERARVLAVGACLPCHATSDDPVWGADDPLSRPRPLACGGR